MELKLCYNCMEPLPEGQTICPACGHDNASPYNSDNAMPEGTILNNKYLVGITLGHGGFGITYVGYDIALQLRVAIKEYFPVGAATRVTNSICVEPLSTKKIREGYRKGIEEFQAEALRLTKIDSPNIVKVRDFFQENGTAYIVMPYLGGPNLTQELEKCGGTIPCKRVLDLFYPLILELDKLHRDLMIHRDIKPDNIKIEKDRLGRDRLVLLDFGAARNYVSAEVTGTYSSILTPGFAPLEQYSPKSRQGPYTDIYALCATMYKLITGVLPAAATDRVLGAAEILTFRELGLDVPQNVEKAIFHGLAIRSEDRPQTMMELYDELLDLRPVLERYSGEPDIPAASEGLRLPTIRPGIPAAVSAVSVPSIKADIPGSAADVVFPLSGPDKPDTPASVPAGEMSSVKPDNAGAVPDSGPAPKASGVPGTGAGAGQPPEKPKGTKSGSGVRKWAAILLPILLIIGGILIYRNYKQNHSRTAAPSTSSSSSASDVLPVIVSIDAKLKFRTETPTPKVTPSSTATAAPVIGIGDTGSTVYKIGDPANPDFYPSDNLYIEVCFANAGSAVWNENYRCVCTDQDGSNIQTADGSLLGRSVSSGEKACFSFMHAGSSDAAPGTFCPGFQLYSDTGTELSGGYVSACFTIQ